MIKSGIEGDMMCVRKLVSSPDPVTEAFKKGIDRTLIRENLKLSPEERVRKLAQLQRFAEELRGAGRKARRIMA